MERCRADASSLVHFAVERVERGASGEQTFPVWQGEASPLAPLEVAASYGAEVCYRVRTMVDSAESSWAAARGVTKLLGVAGRKVAATALARPATKARAERMLREALEDEREISGKLVGTR